MKKLVIFYSLTHLIFFTLQNAQIDSTGEITLVTIDPTFIQAYKQKRKSNQDRPYLLPPQKNVIVPFKTLTDYLEILEQQINENSKHLIELKTTKEELSADKFAMMITGNLIKNNLLEIEIKRLERDIDTINENINHLLNSVTLVTKEIEKT